MRCSRLKRWQFRGIFITSLVITAYALSALFSSVNADSNVPELDTDVTPLSNQSLVNSVLGGGLSARDITQRGTIYTFNHGINLVGIDSGIILETSGRIKDNGYQDPDLKNLMDYSYGGDTASLEFTITSTGTLLNFNYVFVSTEFDQNPRYNDNFGLFVSVNGSAYENIATIPVATGDVPININNLRSGIGHNNEVTMSSLVLNRQYSLFNSTPININNSIQKINGVSNVFNAQKSVSPGDVVKIKFAIADVSDKAYDSYVLIEADSLSFEEQMARINYEREVIERLYSGRTYEVTTDDDTYTFTSSSNGEIPLAGTDKNGNEYDFTGETISLVRKGIGNHPDSDPQTIVIANRPDAPEDIDIPTGSPRDMYLETIEITENSIVLEGSSAQQYSLDQSTWQSPDDSGHVTFTGLTPNTEYTVYTRFAATDNALASDSSIGATILTQNMVRNLTYTIINYEGMYDGEPHFAYVGNLDNAEVRYSEDLYGAYTGTVPEYTEVGNHVVYYFISKEHYYPAYGALHVKIKDYDVINATDETVNFGSAKLLHSNAELKNMFEYDDEVKESLADAATPAEIALVSTDVTNNVDEETVAKFDEDLEEDEKVGKIIDFSLFQKLLSAPEKLTDLTTPVKISFKLPDTLVLPNEETAVRAYRVLRMHNGEVTEIDSEIDENKNISLSTDKLSYFAITYHDIAYNQPDSLADSPIDPATNIDDNDNDGMLIPDTSSAAFTPDTGEMTKTLGNAKACAIATITFSIISAIIALFTISRLRAINTRSRNLRKAQKTLHITIK